jgi:hypothetical protein
MFLNIKFPKTFMLGNNWCFYAWKEINQNEKDTDFDYGDFDDLFMVIIRYF